VTLYWQAGFTEKIIMRSRRFDVVVVGELNPDLILMGDVLPKFGQVEKIVDQAFLTIGSSSAIFACGAARLGLRVAFIGKLGRDLFGDFMLSALRDYGIDTHGVVADPMVSTGISVILTQGTDRAILTYPGTIPRLEFAEIDQAILEQARHLHVGSYFIQDALRPGLPSLFDQAHNLGLSTSLDTNYDPNEKWNEGIRELLTKIDLFMPNAVEAMGITGTSNLDQALIRLKPKVKYLGVKLGKDGALLCYGSQEYRQKPISVKVVDSVGAGDSFDAGLVYGYLVEWEPESMLKLANICGGLSTLKAGGTAGQPTLEEAMRYF
jgi:sugar/nucleoside kinase (ribokinase family)